VLSDFIQVPLTSGSTPIDPASVSITPSVLGTTASLQFAFNAAAAGGLALESFINMRVKPDTFAPDLVDLRLVGATATGDGVVLGIAELCDGFILDVCFGIPQSVVASHTNLGTIPAIPATLGTLSDAYELRQDVVIDAGPSGTASLAAVELTFTTIPEPATVLTLTWGIFVLVAFRRRQVTK
jgi:hypothetical protein